MSPPADHQQRKRLGLRPPASQYRRIIGVLCLLIIVGLLWYLKPGVARQQARAEELKATFLPALELAHPVEREIAQGEKHRYQIRATDAAFLSFSLRPAEFGLFFSISDLHGNLLHCGLTRRLGDTRFSLLTKGPGDYVLEISKPSAMAALLRYQLQWSEQRRFTALDVQRINTEIAMEEAERLHEQLPAECLRLGVDRYLAALKGWKDLNDQREIALTLLGLGITHYYLSQEHLAISYLTQSLPYWRALLDSEGEAAALFQLANANADIGNVLLARDDYARALHLWGRQGKSTGRAAAAIGLGVVNLKMGEFQQALSYYHQALAVYRTTANRLGEVSALAGLGYSYLELGEDRNAIDFAHQQLQLAEQLGILIQRQMAHSHLGLAYLHLDTPRVALEHLQQALNLSERLNAPRLKALALRRVGATHEMLGDYAKALEHYERALPLTQSVHHRQEEALLHNLIGNRHEAQGDKSRALSHYQQALPICQKIEDRVGEITTRHNLAHIQRDLNKLAAAQAQIESTVNLIETLRGRIANRQLRESYFATVQKSYGLYVDILMHQHEQQPNTGKAARAWQANEQVRARSLREMLNENRVEVRAGLPATLLERERVLQEQLNAKANRQLSVTSQSEVETLAREIRALHLRLVDLEGEMRQAAPGYAALTQPQPPSLREVQQQLLDERTALLAYALGEERSYVWLITRQGLQAKPLAKRSEIETQARRVYELLTARLQSAATTNGPGYGERIRQADAQYWQEAAKLSTLILPAEWLTQLPHTSLLVVSDGALQYLPFSALPLPSEAHETPLLIRFEVTNLPSVTVLAELRRQQAGRQPRAKLLAVLADPVYNANDERLRSINSNLAGKTLAAQSSPVPSGLQMRAAAGTLTPLLRLFNAEDEAEAIRKYAPPEQCLVLKGLEVNRGVLDGPQLSDYRLLHFATHGYLDSEQPELSGLVLSNIQADGKEIDGLLRMHEIYRLRLPAELIVLSACQTALGKEVRGEGLIALTRGFMYAGAARVVASLWKVNDATTPQLMDHFYAGMLKEKLSPAAALRQAQKKMLETDRTHAPFYWAAFILQGEPRNFSSPPVLRTQR